jgi:hypothetical protein
MASNIHHVIEGQTLKEGKLRLLTSKNSWPSTAIKSTSLAMDTMATPKLTDTAKKDTANTAKLCHRCCH